MIQVLHKSQVRVYCINTGVLFWPKTVYVKVVVAWMGHAAFLSL
jgi:hypothetical protein